MALVKYNNNSISAVTAAASIPSGALTHIKTLTASSSATLSFVDGSSDGGSNYNVAKTTTWFQAYHFENDGGAGLGYNASRDLAQGTGYQDISTTMTTDNDLSLSGQMELFNPSSTTFVKHFIIRANHMTDNPASNDSYCAGYGNTASAVNAISFRMNSGNLDAGKIKLYGIKDS